jgi:hypothetical protein
MDLDNSLVQKTKIEVPLWIAIPLAAQNIFTIKINKWFDKEYLNIAQAGPTVSNLKEKNSFYF